MEINPKSDKVHELRGMAAKYARAYLMDTDTPLEDVIYDALLDQHNRHISRVSFLHNIEETFLDKKSKATK
jgi:hypothetical protein